MILLTSTSDLVEVTTGSTQSIHVHASYVDNASGTITPGRTNTIIASAATTTVVGSPASSTQRTVKFLSIYNAGSAAETVTVKHTDGTNVVDLYSISLSAGFLLLYNEGSGWSVQSNASPPGTLQALTVLTSTTSTTYTTGANTNHVWVRMVGGGGQGGGGAATAGECGSGGGSGSYLEWFGTVTPSTGYTYSCGAAGSTGGTGASGQAGGNTTITFGATTLTANGGGGGKVGTSAAVPVIGGAGGAISTGGTLNIPGDAGLQSYGSSAADNGSGMGANSPFGCGGINASESAAATGAAATGYGAGGAGATTTGTATAGGAGTQGVIVVLEYA